MKDPLSESVDALYQKRNYPPMSHPVSDPAVSSIAAALGGLKTPHPASAGILEIGCGSGHNLIPLAMRWPLSNFVGIDISDEVIALAKSRAAESGVTNLTFLAADLRTLDFGGETFDYIIAHGFFSWVADDVKAALLEFCPRHLSPSGIATISFNLWTGWEQRLPVIAAARKIINEHGGDEISALRVLREAIEDPHVRWMIDDMLAKGSEILYFDDFAPVNDPWPLDRFAAACANAGLRWLGESDPAENIPSALDEEARASLMHLIGDPLKMQMAADELAGSAFRSGVLCRNDAPVQAKMSTAMVFEMCVRMPEDMPASPEPLLGEFLTALETFGPACVRVGDVLEMIKVHDGPLMARAIFNGITRGYLRPRIEAVSLDQQPVSPLRLNLFRLLCAREKLPLVDAWHVPCLFPALQYELLGRMDGKSTIEELSLISKEIYPDLAFDLWLRHLAERGLLEI